MELNKECCRLCTKSSEVLVNVFNNDECLAEKILTYLSIEISVTDSLPVSCCVQCITTILEWHKFTKTVADAQKFFHTNKEENIKIEEEDQFKIEFVDTLSVDDCDTQNTLLNEEQHIVTVKPKVNHKFYCEICNKGFTRNADVKRHKNTLHKAKVNIKLPHSDPHPPNTDTIHKCQQCDLTFKQLYNLKRHESVHTGQRPFFCHICAKNFRISNGLRRHIREYHEKIKPFSCDTCGKTFTAKTTLEEHKNIHTNNRPYVCDTCGKAFKQKASLHVHKLYHSDVYRFPCDVCGRKYKRATDLKLHGYQHTGHRPHSCPTCGFAFRLKYELKKHLRLHEDSEEHVCLECGLTFKQERYLKRHQKTHSV